MEEKKTKVDLKDIIFKPDLLNLTNDDIEEILKDLEIKPEKDIDKVDYLYEMKNLLFNNDKVRDSVKNKIFAGRTSVKWYTFKVDSEAERETIKQNLESASNYYNDIYNLDVSNLQSPAKYTCIKNGENNYIMRIMVPTGTKTIGSGMNLQRYTNISNIVVIIDLSNQYIEIRASNYIAKRIIDYITGSLSIKNVIEADLLKRYNGSIEKFKNSLCNGRFTETLGAPDLDITLTKEKSELLANILQIIDDYFMDKSIEDLENQLSNIDIDTEGIPFTQLLLAGMSKIGMGMREDVNDDLSCQTLYKAFKLYITEHKGFINFSTTEDGPIYTIQLGITTKSISFRSSVTEDVIEYIRNKIL